MRGALLMQRVGLRTLQCSGGSAAQRVVRAPRSVCRLEHSRKRSCTAVPASKGEPLSANPAKAPADVKGRHHEWRAGATGTLDHPVTTQTSHSLYDFPDIYELAFSFRDFPKEVEFLKTVYQLYCGKPATSFLELGCGPAKHSILLAKEQKEVFALDQNVRMLDYARQKAGQEGVGVTFLKHDMCDFTLPAGAQVDMAFLLLGGLHHVLTNAQAMGVLQAASDALKPGGVLVLELAHPLDIFDGTLLTGDAWEVPTRMDGKEGRLVVEYGDPDDDFDSMNQVLHRNVRMNLYKDSELAMTLEEVVPQRVFTFQEISWMSELSRFQLAGAFGEMQLGTSVDSEDAYRMVLCLKKAGR